jgi:hypothetical protein
MNMITPALFLRSRTQQGLQINRSIRLNDDDSPYFTRTFGTPTLQTKWTLSMWIKRGNLGSVQTLFCSSGTRAYIRFNSSDELVFFYNATLYRTTDRVFRDPTAWMHLVFEYNQSLAAADQLKVWVNGIRATTTGGTSIPAGNTLNSAIGHQIGRNDGTGDYFDGYIAETYFIDGLALDPTNFGEFNLTTGVWVPKRYSGAYGNNGFYLDFEDNSNTTSATLGKDRSGNNNDWTPNNFSVAAGEGNDSLEDTPTNNFPTLNVLTNQFTAAPLQNGGLSLVGSASNQGATSLFGMTTGKWYWEVLTGATAAWANGIVDAEASSAEAGNYPGAGALSWSVGASNGNKYNSGSNSAYGSAFVAGDIAMFAFDADTGKFYVGKNGTWFASGDPVSGTNPAFTVTTGKTYLAACGHNVACTQHINFGQRPFTYTPPTGFKALCTKNLAEPSVKDPTTRISSFTRTGTGSSGSKTGLKFQPDLVRVKRYTTGNQITPHFTVARGTGKYKPVQTNVAETVDAQSLTAFNADGFDFGTSTVLNASAVDYLFLCLKDDPSNGIQIVTWTGDGNATKVINHNLGKKPSMALCHGMGATLTYLWHKAFASDAHWCDITTTLISAELNSNSPFSAWGSSSFTVTNNATNNLNDSGVEYVALLFADGPLFASGKYTANANANGPLLYAGFRPALVCWSATNNQQWPSVNEGVANNYNGNTAQSSESFMTGNGVVTYTGSADLLSIGAKIRSSAVNYQSGTGRPWFALAKEAGKYSNAV